MSKDTMEALFNTFKESIEEMNEDKEYIKKKMEMYNEIGDAVSDYMKELNEAGMNMWGAEESEDLTKITNAQIEAINKFEKQIPLIGKTLKSIKIPNKDKKKEVLNNLKALKKNVRNKKVDIKVAKPNITTIKLTPIQKLKYLKRKNA